jgi:hypothetical protein
MVGKTIVNQGRVVRPSQLIRGVSPTWWMEAMHGNEEETAF